jgi:hypothetical protein
MMKKILLAICLILIAGYVGCSKDKSPTAPQGPKVDQVIIVGTQVEPDFRTTKRFLITALPQDEAGEAIISDKVVPTVTMQLPNLTAQSAVSLLNPPSNKTLAVALDIDGSGSMVTTDPSRLRVSGAKRFFDVLQASGRNFTSAVFAYRGTPRSPFLNTELLQAFTNNITNLKTATDRVRQDSDTPTYESLLEVLAYTDTARSATSFDRKIVLLSDGQPNSLALRDQMCQTAKQKGILIFTIGLGPASDIDSLRRVTTAVENMRFIANCTGGAYAGISPTDPNSTNSIYASIASASAGGSIVITVTLSGSGFNAIGQGTIVRGTLTLASGGASASGSFSFSAP